MSVQPGTRIGPYEVTAQIGPGGMGEVYRATDNNLARQVAIKVLPETVAGDPDRPACFAREAKTLAYFQPLTLSGRTYDTSPDDRFLMIERAAAGDDARATQIVLVQHWF